MQVSDDARAGSELAGYRNASLLGAGGMSVVYLAEDLRLKRRVALKLLAAELAEAHAAPPDCSCAAVKPDGVPAGPVQATKLQEGDSELAGAAPAVRAAGQPVPKRTTRVSSCLAPHI